MEAEPRPYEGAHAAMGRDRTRSLDSVCVHREFTNRRAHGIAHLSSAIQGSMVCIHAQFSYMRLVVCDWEEVPMLTPLSSDYTCEMRAQ